MWNTKLWEAIFSISICWQQRMKYSFLISSHILDTWKEIYALGSLWKPYNFWHTKLFFSKQETIYKGMRIWGVFMCFTGASRTERWHIHQFLSNENNAWVFSWVKITFFSIVYPWTSFVWKIYIENVCSCLYISFLYKSINPKQFSHIYLNLYFYSNVVI